MNKEILNVPEGKLTVAYGPMFANKSSFLIGVARRWQEEGKQYFPFKHACDTRYDNGCYISSHNGDKIRAFPIESAKQLFYQYPGFLYENVIIDEAQFFEKDLIELVDCLERRECTIVLAGLNLDFRGVPFGPMAELICRAANPVSLTAVCKHTTGEIVCNGVATRTQRLIDGVPAKYSDPVVLVGAKESYEPKCVHHHIVPEKPRGLFE